MFAFPMVEFLIGEIFPWWTNFRLKGESREEIHWVGKESTDRPIEMLVSLGKSKVTGISLVPFNNKFVKSFV